jgi:exocyst complex component 5
MAHLILKEIEQENFSIDSTIETLIYKATDGKVGQDSFDPLFLEQFCMQTIEDLKKISGKSKLSIEKLEVECDKEKAECKEKVAKLEGNYKESYDNLMKLDKRISSVSATMSEMGAQLENLNKPRHNLSEAQKIAKYYDKFMEGIDNSGVFSDDSKLEQAAEIIYKLHLLANDLKDQRFIQANALINSKYKDIEFKLIQSFHQSFFRADKKSMKKYIRILYNFKEYQTCISEFIKNSQLPMQYTKDIFADIIPLCKSTNEIITEIFNSNERVMEQFVRDLFLGRVQHHVNSNIKQYEDNDSDKYLETIYLSYNKTQRIFNDISDLMKLSKESNFFIKLMTDLYGQHLENYVQLEKNNLQQKFKAHLERFYNSIGHTRKQGTGIRNILNYRPAQSEIIDEKFLSHDDFFRITTLCIDDAKKSIKRITLVNDK